MDFEIRGNTLVKYFERSVVATVPQGVETIGTGAFCGCLKLRSVSLPDGVLHIGDHAFGGCRNLSKINLPPSVTTIGEYAFQFCESLPMLQLPKAVSAIGNGAFRYCTSLAGMRVSGAPLTGYEAFYGCDALSLLDAPSCVFARLPEPQKVATALTYCENPAQFGAQARAAYETYLSHLSEAFMQALSKREDVLALQYLTEHSLIGELQTDRFIKYAQDEGAYQVVSALIDYKNKQYGSRGFGRMEEDLFL